MLRNQLVRCLSSMKFFFSMDYPNLVWMKVNGTTSRPSFKGYRQLFALWGRLLNRDILTLWNQEKKQGLNMLLQRFFHFKYCHIEPSLLFDSSAFSCRILFVFFTKCLRWTHNITSIFFPSQTVTKYLVNRCFVRHCTLLTFPNLFSRK